MKNKLLLLTIALLLNLSFSSCNKEGCTESHADNYDKKANTDNGTCSYADGFYSYAMHDQVHIMIGMADAWGPIGESDIELSHDGATIKTFLELLTENSYYFDSKLFLNADVKNGDQIVASAAAFGMSGSGWVQMNSEADLDFVTIY